MDRFSQIVSHLPELQPHSGKRLYGPIARDLKRRLANAGLNPVQLVKPVMVANSNWIHKPRAGAESLIKPAARQSICRVISLSLAQENNLTYRLNTALLGGQSYPVLTAVLGTAAGVASFGAGLIFTASTVAMSLSQVSQRVLARRGDQIWQVEEIGKVRESGNFKPVHVSSYFIFDPYRSHAEEKGLANPRGEARSDT